MLNVRELRISRTVPARVYPPCRQSTVDGGWDVSSQGRQAEAGSSSFLPCLRFEQGGHTRAGASPGVTAAAGALTNLPSTNLRLLRNVEDDLARALALGLAHRAGWRGCRGGGMLGMLTVAAFIFLVFHLTLTLPPSLSPFLPASRSGAHLTHRGTNPYSSRYSEPLRKP